MSEASEAQKLFVGIPDCKLRRFTKPGHRASFFCKTCGLLTRNNLCPFGMGRKENKMPLRFDEARREIAAQMLASKMLSTEWRDLQPFTRAKYRTAILTMERIFDSASRAALKQSLEKMG